MQAPVSMKTANETSFKMGTMDFQDSYTIKKTLECQRTRMTDRIIPENNKPVQLH